MRSPLKPWLPADAPRALMSALLVSLLVGCASRGPAGSGTGRDGPPAHPPPNLAQLPDAEPKVEPIRIGGPNKPYEVWGQSYLPMTQDLPFRERGLASWYGRRFDRQPTASGEPYDMYAMTAAHPTLPIPSYARIRNPANGRQVIVRINDRGPFHSGRIVDLSYTAALKLDLLGGTRPVELERITFDDIRTGAWRQDPADPAQPWPIAAAPAAAARPDATPTVAAAPAALPPPAPTGVDDHRTSAPSRAADTLRADATAPRDAGESPPVVGAAPTVVAAVADSAAAAGSPSFPPPVADSASSGYWVQLGAFRQHDGALAFQKQVEAQVAWLMPLLTVVGDATLFKLQAGPYASREAAREAAGRLRGVLLLVPMVVERR